MKSEKGSATIVGLFLVAAIGFGIIGVGSIAALYSARNHANTAADAAALAAAVATYPAAGAEDPLAEARRYARLNGAVVQSCRCPVDTSLRIRTVTVIVQLTVKVPFFGVLPIRAGARGEFDPGAWLGRK
jgi:secretion/DNA translocation related TadE-like protein